MKFINYLGKGSGLWVFVTCLLAVLILLYFLIKRSSKKEYAGEIICSLFFIELAVVFGVLTLGFPNKGDEVGPGVVPFLWIIGILVFAVFILIRTFFKVEEKDPEWGRIGVVFVFISATILYIFLMNIIGYFIATAVYLVFGMYYLSYRNWKVMLSLTAGWILFSYFIFYRLLFVPLPKGLFFEWILG